MIYRGVIYEYDIAQCDISVLRELDMITEIEYVKYKNMKKEDRVIKIGLLKRSNPNIDLAIRKYVNNLMSDLIKNNKLKEDNVFEIAFDAIWVTKPLRHHLNIGKYIKIRNKREYNILLVIGKVHYYLNTLTDSTLKRFEAKSDTDAFVFDCMRYTAKVNMEKELYKYIHTNRLKNKNNREFINLSNEIIDILLN